MVAYAIAGTIRFDIENDVLGYHNGEPIYLKDIYPSDDEIDEIVAKCVKPEQFKEIYIPMFDLDKSDKASNPLYDWREKSTYIRRPPYWEEHWQKNANLKTYDRLPFCLIILPPTICRPLMPLSKFSRRRVPCQNGRARGRF